jgi:electron transfer flavoprotein beta subunit
VTLHAVVGVRSSPHRVDSRDAGIDPYRWRINLLDQVAVEAALRSADEVTVVGLGGDRARDAIRATLRMGADAGVWVAYDPVEEAAGEKYAKVLGRAAGRERADALFVGETAPLMGVEVAGLAGSNLDWPSVSQVTALGSNAVAAEVDPGAGELAAQRKLATGTQEVVVTETPAVLGIDGSFANPRRASFDTAVAGQRAEIRQADLEDVAPGESRFSMSVGRATVESVTPNERWGRGHPPTSGTVEERIRRMLGRGEGGGEGGGELLTDVDPEAAAEHIVEELRARELL